MITTSDGERYESLEHFIGDELSHAVEATESFPMDANAIAQIPPPMISSLAMPEVEKLSPSVNVDDRRQNYGGVGAFIDKTKAGVQQIRDLMEGRSPFQADDLSENKPIEAQLGSQKDIENYTQKMVQDNVDRRTEYKTATDKYYTDVFNYEQASDKSREEWNAHSEKLDKWIASNFKGKPPQTPAIFKQEYPKYPEMRRLKY